MTPSSNGTERSVQRRELVSALAGAALVLICVVIEPSSFFPAYLAGVLFVLSVPLGCVTLMMTHQLTGGRWGGPVAAAGLPASRIMFVIPLLMLPLIVGAHWLYPWTNESIDANHRELLEKRGAWMSVTAVALRGVAALVLWIGLAIITARWWSDLAPQREPHRHAGAAAAGLIGMVITVSFVSVDWLLSLQAQPYSSIFGLTIFMSMCVHALAFTILASVAAARQANFEPDRRLLRDLGALLLAALTLEAYVNFSQFFIIWNGNLEKQIAWYLPRSEGVWLWVGVVMIAARYVVTIGALVSHRIKRSPRALSVAAAITLASGALYATWQSAPSTQAPPLMTLLASLGAVTMLSAIGFRVFRLRSRTLSAAGRMEDALRA